MCNFHSVRYSIAVQLARLRVTLHVEISTCVHSTCVSIPYREFFTVCVCAILGSHLFVVIYLWFLKRIGLATFNCSANYYQQNDLDRYITSVVYHDLVLPCCIFNNDFMVVDNQLFLWFHEVTHTHTHIYIYIHTYIHIYIYPLLQHCLLAV